MTKVLNKYSVHLLLLIMIVFTGDLSAAIVQGEVSGDWTIEDHPYDVLDDIVLRAGDVLNIEAGVRINFRSGTRFEVFGTLLANGEEGDSILFRANNGVIGDWQWLKFDGNGANQSVLNYCIIMNTDRGVHFFNSNPTIINTRISHNVSPCVRFEGSRGNLKNSNIANSQGIGIIVQSNSSPNVNNCSITQHPNNGISLRDNSGGVISGNTILAITNHGISLNAAGACSLSYNIISGCGLNAINVSQSNLTGAFRNIIFLNRGDYAIYLFRSESIDLVNNTIVSNLRTGLGVIRSSVNVINNIIISNERDGIFVQESNTNQSSNCVWNNSRDDYSGLEPAQSNINESPQLDQEYVPAEDSPVVDRGDNRYRDADGTRSDIGARFFNQNSPPEIQRFWPVDVDEIQGDTEQEFGVEAEDAQNHDLTYIWLVNGLSSGNESVLTHTFTVDGNYEVTVIIDDSFYEGQTLFSWNFTVIGSGINIEPNVIADNFNLSTPYPNPFNGVSQFNLTVSALGVANVSLVDLNGRTMKRFHSGIIQKGQHVFTVNSDDFPAGNFIISAEINGRKEQRKIVILK